MFLNFLKKNTPRFLYDILKMIYHILRYYGLINPNYSTSNLVRFGEKKCGNFIKKKILKSKFYLEFGSGNTTVFASQNNKNYYSIESDKNFLHYLKRKKIKNLFFYSLGWVEFYSYPLLSNKYFKNFYQKKSIIYASTIFDTLDKNQIIPDLILVDGRFRVLCMLYIFKFLKKKKVFGTCIILDDFKDREHYQIIKNFFKVRLIGRLGICYAKKNFSITQANRLIKKYSQDPR